MTPDPLDHLLSLARWPEATPESHDRLRCLIGVTATPRASFSTSRWTIGMVISAAAAMLLVVLYVKPFHQTTPPSLAPLAVLNQRPSNTPEARLQIVGEPLSPSDRFAILLSKIHHQAEAVQRNSQPVSQAPTADVSLAKLQRLVIHPDQEATLIALLPNAPSWVIEALQGQAISAEAKVACDRELLRRGNAEVACVVMRLFDPGDCASALAALRASGLSQDTLIQHFSDPLVQTRLAAAAAMGELADDNTARRLIGMFRQERQPREVLAALLESPNATARQFIDDYQHHSGAAVSTKLELRSLRAELPVLN